MKERKVRLFISSTFRDMNAERDYLNNIVFPQVKDYCKSRYIDFISIDLRWGITEEASRNALVLASCMEEVDNSRPFFVGILGLRYGWMPTVSELKCSRPPVTQNMDWLRSKIAESASITEIEMDYAVLRDKSIPHASFFIKACDITVEPDFCEPKGSLAERKLEKLKEKIRKQKKYPVHDYHNVKELGDTLLKELLTMIDEEFPCEGDDYFCSVINRHEASLQRHAFSLFEVTTTIESNMEKWGKSNYGLLLFTGPSGSGTSNSLALTVQYLRKTYRQNRVLYYDFECADPQKDLMDDFMEFIQMSDNNMPDDQWSMLAIDNASLLDIENTERMLHWVRERPVNLHPVFAASTSVFSESIFLWHCSTITQNGLTHHMQYEMVRNFALLYGKELTKNQQQKIVSCKRSNDPTILTILLNTLINFGSMEQLDQRIHKLVDDANYSIFSGLMMEAEENFRQVNLEMQFVQTIVVVAMHGNEGISETDLLEALSISMADWAVIRPMVLQFCHGYARKMRFTQQVLWSQDIKNRYNTSWIAHIGYKMVEWWAKQKDRLKESASAMAAIYLFVWHLPFENGEDEQLKQHMLSILLSPETILHIPLFYHSALLSFKWFNEIPFSTVPNLIIGKALKNLSLQDQLDYYRQLVKISESQNRYKETAWCYRQMAKLQATSYKAKVLESYSLLAEGKAEAAVKNVTGLLGRIIGSPTEQLQKRLVRQKAFLLRGAIDDYLKELEKIFVLGDSMNDIEEERYDFICLWIETCYELAFKGGGELLKMSSELINMAINKEMLQDYSIASPIYYYFCMARLFLYFRGGQWEQVLQFAKDSMNSASFAYGYNSYQYGRAHALHNYAYYQLHGKVYDSRSVYVNHYNPLPYRRTYNKLLADKAVLNSIEKENEFYETIVKEMGAKQGD